METKEYIVTLRDGVDYNQFWADMESATNDVQFVPDRMVDIANNRTAFDCICEYFLTDQEADQLRKDSRVMAVEIPINKDPNIIVSYDAEPTVTNKNYSKTTSSSGSQVNWGLVRHSSTSDGNPRSAASWINGTTTEKYSYRLDGTGVDIVIIDSGIQTGHPEFGTRLKSINWTNYYSNYELGTNQNDTDGHGTHVAGIAAGNTYGWAKGADVYSLSNRSVQSGQPDLNPLDYLEALINWHNQKSIDPVTGVKRPTVANMSFILALSFTAVSTIIGGNYRGVDWTKTSNFNLGSVGILNIGRGHPHRLAHIDQALQRIIDAGIVVIRSGGNHGYKVDVEGGADYNNYFVTSTDTNYKYYYHRAGSPMAPGVIVVGNLDSELHISNLEQRSYRASSAAGPRIDVWAAGTYVMSACSNINVYNGQPYQHGDSNFKQVNISGTSMSAPQIAGMCALYLQKYPAATPEEVRSWVKISAVKGRLYSVNQDNDYTNPLSLLGGTAGVANQNIEGLDYSHVKDNTSTWKKVKATYVKRKDGTWARVKTAYKRENGEWVRFYQL